jgi:hypothetical protein
MTKSKQFHTAAVVTFFASATALGAQTFDGPIGYAEVQLNFGNATDNRPPDSTFDYLKYGFQGQYGFPLFANGILGAEITYRPYSWDESQADFDTSDVPEKEFRLSFHYTHALSDNFRLGGFGGYTRSALVVDDLQKEQYETLFGGFEVQYFIGEQFMLYGQAGIGNTFNRPPDQSAASPEGFNDASFQRVGVTWFPIDSTAITIDYEAARSDAYLDGAGDRGEFQALELSGETRLPTDLPLTVTYYARRADYETSAGNSAITDVSMGLGVRMLFGADTPSESWRSGRFVGAPSLPSQAADWLEALD